MDIQEYINQKKEFYNLFLTFLESEDEIYNQAIIADYIKETTFFDNPEVLKETLRLISKVS